MWLLLLVLIPPTGFVHHLKGSSNKKGETVICWQCCDVCCVCVKLREHRRLFITWLCLFAVLKLDATVFSVDHTIVSHQPTLLMSAKIKIHVVVTTSILDCMRQMSTNYYDCPHWHVEPLCCCEKILHYNRHSFFLTKGVKRLKEKNKWFSLLNSGVTNTLPTTYNSPWKKHF